MDIEILGFLHFELFRMTSLCGRGCWAHMPMIS